MTIFVSLKQILVQDEDRSFTAEYQNDEGKYDGETKSFIEKVKFARNNV